jgi:hypothetical protein
MMADRMVPRDLASHPGLLARLPAFLHSTDGASIMRRWYDTIGVSTAST